MAPNMKLIKVRISSSSTKHTITLGKKVFTIKPLVSTYRMRQRDRFIISVVCKIDENFRENAAVGKNSRIFNSSDPRSARRLVCDRCILESKYPRCARITVNTSFICYLNPH
jgi:hypothetical protein